MSPFWAFKGSKSSEVVKNLKQCMKCLQKLDRRHEKAQEEINKHLLCIKNIFLRSKTDDTRANSTVVHLASELCESGMLLTLIQNIEKFDFESKKDVSHIFNNILNVQGDSSYSSVEYVSETPEILFLLLSG